MTRPIKEDAVAVNATGPAIAGIDDNPPGKLPPKKKKMLRRIVPMKSKD